MIGEVLTALIILGGAVTFAGTTGLVGALFGQATERRKWLALKNVAIPGQRIHVQYLGEVFVLGYSEDEQYVDVISTEFLTSPDGKPLWPSQIDQDVLAANTNALKTEQFLTQLPEQSYKKAASS